MLDSVDSRVTIGSWESSMQSESCKQSDGVLLGIYRESPDPRYVVEVLHFGYEHHD